MSLDPRMPIGLMFTLTGVLLTVLGLASRGAAIYAICRGVDVNLCWGLVLLTFGLILLFLGSRGQKQIESQRQLADSTPTRPIRRRR
jgi:hypothetical protein